MLLACLTYTICINSSLPFLCVLQGVEAGVMTCKFEQAVPIFPYFISSHHAFIAIVIMRPLSNVLQIPFSFTWELLSFFLFGSRYLGECSLSGDAKVLGGQERPVSQSGAEEESWTEKLLTGTVDPTGVDTEWKSPFNCRQSPNETQKIPEKKNKHLVTTEDNCQKNK